MSSSTDHAVENVTEGRVISNRGRAAGFGVDHDICTELRRDPSPVACGLAHASACADSRFRSA
jgi:hypothetical protein